MTQPEFKSPWTLLPHEEPFLYLDEDGIQNISRHPDNNEITGLSANWTPGAQHFLERQKLREIKLVEGIAQAGAVAIYYDIEDKRKRPLPLFQGIEYAEFDQSGRPVEPGDTVNFDVKVLQPDKRGFKGIGIAKVDNDIVCKSVISGIMMPPRVGVRYLHDSEAQKPTERLSHNFGRAPASLVDFDPRDLWLDGVIRKSETEAEGFWRPPLYQYEGHAFGAEYDDEGNEVTAPQPILAGIKQVGSLEDLARAAWAGTLDLKIVRDVSFLRKILPGERLENHVEIGELTSTEGDRRLLSRGKVQVAGQLACEAELVFARAA